MKVNDLCAGEHFEYYGRVYCILEFNPYDETTNEEALVVQIKYKGPNAIGNPVVTIDSNEEIKFIERPDNMFQTEDKD